MMETRADGEGVAPAPLSMATGQVPIGSEARRAQEDISFLALASKRLADSLDYDVTLQSIVDLVVPYLADYCLVDMIEGGGTVRRVAVAHVDPNQADLKWELWPRYPDDVTLPADAASVISTRQPLLIPELPDESQHEVAEGPEHRHALPATKARSAMILPLLAHGRLLGTMVFAIITPGRRYSQADLALAQELVHRCSLAIDNARLYGEAQQARAEAERQVVQMNTLLSLISHDLREPLTVMIGHAHWLQRILDQKGDLSEARSADTILQCGMRLNAMIQDLVESARMEGGQLVLQKQRADLVSVIVALSERAVTAEQRPRLRLELPSGPLLLEIDPVRLERAILNLISNALKYSPSPLPVIVSVVADDHEATISVIDRGPGIASEDLAHLFERFYRAQAIRRADGLGLGLYIARLITEAHGGRIWVESEVGKGSTFSIALPL